MRCKVFQTKSTYCIQIALIRSCHSPQGRMKKGLRASGPFLQWWPFLGTDLKHSTRSTEHVKRFRRIIGAPTQYYVESAFDDHWHCTMEPEIHEMEERKFTIYNPLHTSLMKLVSCFCAAMTLCCQGSLLYLMLNSHRAIGSGLTTCLQEGLQVSQKVRKTVMLIIAINQNFCFC